MLAFSWSILLEAAADSGITNSDRLECTELVSTGRVEWYQKIQNYTVLL